jgi:hypothetical protein
MNACLYCQKTFSNTGGLGAHHPYCKSNPARVKRFRSVHAGAKKGNIPWNTGLSKETSERVRNQGKRLAERYANGSLKYHSHPHSEETKKRLSEVAKSRKLGGYVRGSGRGKKGWYKGFFCDSSWELAYVIYCLEHNIDIKRNTERRSYQWGGKTKNYIPDFLVNNILIEFKGYKTAQWLAKLEANPDITVLYEKDLKPILGYVIQKYGKDFTKLYE